MIYILSPAYLTYPIIVPSLLCQTSPRWRLEICHDGQDDNFIRWIIKDERVVASSTEKRLGYWGHPIRNMLLEQLDCDPEDYVIITNHDNYFMPNTIDSLEIYNEDFVCWTIFHNYYNNLILSPKIEFGHIDISQIAVKARIAKSVGWHWIIEASDFLYIQECWIKSKTYKILTTTLGVHN